MAVKKQLKALKKAPSHLKATGGRLWSIVNSEYPLNESSGQVLLQGCEALDRLEQIKSELKTVGLTFTDKFNQPKLHPLVTAEGNARMQFVRCMRLLNLNLSEFLDESNDEDTE